MKICLCFHCLCESYDDVPDYSRELYVSLEDIADMVERLQRQGYRFAPLDDPGPNTVTVTFDDGYFNNLLFKAIALSYEVPYVIFVSAYYLQSGAGFPWLANSGKHYGEMHDFDYYAWHAGDAGAGDPVIAVQDSERPMTFEELEELSQTSPVEIGCHGYYHQPLSDAFEQYLTDEKGQGMSSLQKHLGLRPRYFALANGIYTKNVVTNLLLDFDRVLTIEGRPFHRRDRVIHRLTMLNPNLGISLTEQIDKHLNPIRRLRRAIRTYGRLGL